MCSVSSAGNSHSDCRIGAPSWCRDVPYVDFFGGDLCETMTRAEIFRMVGHPPVEIFDMSDDGSILVSILDPMMMAAILPNPELKTVAAEAREKLERVARSLEA